MAAGSGTEVASGYVTIGARVHELERGLAKAQAQLSAFGDKARKQTQQHERNIRLLGRAAGVGALGIAAGFGAAVKIAGDFEAGLNQLRAVSGASGKDLDRLRQSALRLGASTKFSAREVVGAQTELAKSGLTTAQILGGALPAALNLAAAGNLEVADAAKFTANAMNLFGLEGGKATKVADAFAYAANATSADVHDFGLALAQGGSAARAAGLSFRETMLALTALAKQGIKGSDAGTSLKSALLALLTPTKQQAEAAKAAGLSFTDAQGRMKSMADISAMLQERTARMTQAQRTALFATLAGTDGVRTLLALYQTGPAALGRYSAGLDRSGTAARTAATMNQGLNANLEQLKGALETLAIVVGSKLLPPLASGASAAANMVQALASGNVPLRELAPLLDAVGTAFSLLAQPQVASAILGVASALVVAKMAAIGFSVGMKLATAALSASPWMLLATAVGAIAGVFLSYKLGAAGAASETDRAAAAARAAASAFAGLKNALDSLTDANLRVREAKLGVRTAMAAQRQVMAQVASGALKGAAADRALAQAQIGVERAQLDVTRAMRSRGTANQQALAQSRRIAQAVPAEVNALRSQVAALNQQRTVARATGASQEQLARINGQLSTKTHQLNQAMERLPSRTAQARKTLEALAKQAGPKAAAEIRKLQQELGRNTAAAKAGGVRAFGEALSGSGQAAGTARPKVAAFKDSVDTAGFAATLAASQVRDLSAAIAAVPDSKTVRIRTEKTEVRTTVTKKGESSLPGKGSMAMEAGRGRGMATLAGASSTTDSMVQLLGSGRVQTGLRDAIASAQEFGVALDGAAAIAGRLAAEVRQSQVLVGQLATAKARLDQAKSTKDADGIRTYSALVASLTKQLGVQQGQLVGVGRTAAQARDQLVSMTKQAQTLGTAAAAAFDKFRERAMAAVSAPYEDRFRVVGNSVELLTGHFTNLDRAQDAALSGLDDRLASTLSGIESMRSALTPAEAQIKALEDAAAAGNLQRGLEDARSALAEALVSRDPKAIREAQQRLGDAEREVQLAELRKTAEAERAERDRIAGEQATAAEAQAVKDRQAIQDEYTARRLQLEANLAAEQAVQQTALDKLEQQLGKVPGLIAAGRARNHPELVKLRNQFGAFGDAAGSEFVTELKRELSKVDTAIARTLADKVAPYLELHSPADKGPLSKLDTWWSGLVPTLMQGVGGDVGAALGALPPPSTGGAAPAGGVTVHIHLEGATTLGDSRDTARELSRILKPELDRLVSVRV